MKELINIKNLSVSYDNLKVIDNISLKIFEGEFVGIIGPNGGGKSTLLKAMLGLINIDSGIINVKEDKIGYVPQFSSVDKRFPISVLEVVLSGMIDKNIKPFFKFNKEMIEKAYNKLEQVGIKDLADRQISELSGGQFQRMLIARALAVDPQILFLDEPTASVDTVSMNNIYELLEKINKDTTIVLVTHDLMSISKKVSKVVCLNKKVVYYGKPILEKDTLDHLYGL